jgi:trans-2-enoyl-CoA reductase
MCTKIRKSNSSARVTRKCSALSASSSTLTPNMKSYLALIKVRNTFGLFNKCIVVEMRRMVKEMLDEVESVDKNNTVCEELYGKLE